MLRAIVAMTRLNRKYQPYQANAKRPTDRPERPARTYENLLFSVYIASNKNHMMSRGKHKHK